MSEKTCGVYTFTLQTEPGSDGREPARVLTPDEIIQPSDTEFVDEHKDFYVKHQMRRTARKQAGYLVKDGRRAELDKHRAVCAMKMINDLTAEAARHMNDLCHFADSCSENLHPMAAVRVQAIRDRGLEIQQMLPEAGVRLFLQRYALG